MAQSKGAIFYPEHIAVARGLLTDAEIGKLFLAVSDYAESGCIPDIPSKAWGVCFDLMRSAIDKNAQRYTETCARNRRNIEKRWNRQDSSSDVYDGIPANTTVYDGIPANTTYTNRTEPNQTEPNQTEPNQAEKNCCVRTKRFTPPTVEEVKAYCTEIGRGIDAERFVDFYTANGWRVGKNPMRDWRATVRNWAKREGSFQAAPKASDVQKGFRPVPTQEEYLEGLDPSGFGWA